MNIVVGSRSLIKLLAVKEAFFKLGFEPIIASIEVSSGQNEQPVGFDETFAGALNRAAGAKSRCPNRMAIGIESGIFRFGTKKDPVTLDLAVIVVITDDRRRIITTSQGIQFPEKCVRIAEKQGFNRTTVGHIMAKRLGGDPADPHKTITQYRLKRRETLVNALVAALIQVPL